MTTAPEHPVPYTLTPQAHAALAGHPQDAHRGIAAELASTTADIAADVRLTGHACPASLEYASELIDALTPAGEASR